MSKTKDMLKALEKVEKDLPMLLRDESGWNSVYVNYHPPYVERLWRQWGKYRLYLHRIHTCKREKALFHPHPWPSAMHVLSGRYEMAVGYGKGKKKPPIVATIMASGDFRYEMTNPDGWHYVRPVGGVAMTVMVTGKPWNRSSPKSTKILRPLNEEKKKEIINFFRKIYE